jgi:hypothetical protein
MRRRLNAVGCGEERIGFRSVSRGSETSGHHSGTSAAPPRRRGSRWRIWVREHRRFSRRRVAHHPCRCVMVGSIVDGRERPNESILVTGQLFCCALCEQGFWWGLDHLPHRLRPQPLHRHALDPRLDARTRTRQGGIAHLWNTSPPPARAELFTRQYFPMISGYVTIETR